MTLVGDRVRGALVGLAVGDALGTTLEFKRTTAPAFPALATGPHREMTGKGPFNLEPGQVTDDTQLACCIADSLRENAGFDAADLAARYVKWAQFAFDIGNQTQAAIRRLKSGATPANAGREVWLATQKTAAGNGSLMRTAPIGVFFARDAGPRREAALGDSALTHYDPRCSIACAAFDAAIAAAVTGGDPEAMMQAALSEVPAAASLLSDRFAADGREITGAAVDLTDDLAAARQPDPELYVPGLHIHETQGFVRVAFRLAFWELMHAPTFEDGLIDAVNRGGDADTNGAITGALLGAVHDSGAIPARWTNAVLAAMQSRPAGPFRDDYHPRRLMQLADVLTR